IPAQFKILGTHLLDRLNQLKARFSFITEVRGKGLLAAIYFDSDISGQVLTLANQAGLLLNGVRPNAVRFMPPLTVTAEEIDEAMGRLEEALKQI
ncbi:MAG: aminotransferase class III-fold pyridoxal phosphate-dependent enzyme, partial [Chloroflexi bacterium]|nr:aminotransferase class III-fold pyridoxal phosphate-dependent enzyme [Chloroflexota bacterium]